MIEITPEIYRLVATRLRDEIANAEWFNGSIEFDTDESTAETPDTETHVVEGIHARLTLTAIIYRRTEHLPEGECRPIADVVPVWWEFTTSTTTDDGIIPAPNNFSFSELKTYLVDHD
jgi:hypothetical protein